MVNVRSKIGVRGKLRVRIKVMDMSIVSKEIEVDEICLKMKKTGILFQRAVFSRYARMKVFGV